MEEERKNREALLEARILELEAENARLKRELARLREQRKSASQGSMSSRLKDALRE
ncbi:hypothetical protein MJA45_02400 [Paenibacillus aurantius]|uniref:Transposase n=1 Tax=Paenibacillus aurantius TaxID=2918900 RepID=A0AA96LEW2_9BACL|nr:hypothetical protein [Paenibacillus aurantius]WJH36596.1 hypothetical protein N6H14_13105 [Paenibacillus sp. CC-CFT747]WNQ11929.1 hypothetical protein MJA45_02400 [Paenibacillus aurantius]